MKLLFIFLLLIPHLSQAELQFAEESHQLPIAKGEFLHLKVKRPIGVKQKTIPAILLFGGFETSDKSIQLVNPTKPILLVTFAYPFTAPRKVSVWRDYKLIPQIKTALHNTNTGIARLVEWAQLQKEADPAQIYLAGVSLGAPLAMMAARPPIKGFVLVHGFGDIESTMAYSLV